MPNNVVNILESEPAVNSNRTPTQEHSTLLGSLVGSVTISGSGNPNGVTSGIIDQLYRDTTGGPPVLYVNTDGGTTWVGV